MGTESITNPNMDKGFEIDESNYHRPSFRMKKISTKRRVICDECGSKNCSIIDVVEDNL